MLTIDTMIAVMSLAALALSVLAYMRVSSAMLAAMGPLYVMLVMTETTVAALIPLVDSFWPNTWLVNVLRGALLATLIVMFASIAALGIHDKKEGL